MRPSGNTGNTTTDPGCSHKFPNDRHAAGLEHSIAFQREYAPAKQSLATQNFCLSLLSLLFLDFTPAPWAATAQQFYPSLGPAPSISYILLAGASMQINTVIVDDERPARDELASC